jgi:hypothetical protein
METHENSTWRDRSDQRPGFFAKGSGKDGKGPGDFSSWMMATFLGSKVRENMLSSNMFQSYKL